jgi:hypothetical protein
MVLSPDAVTFILIFFEGPDRVIREVPHVY